MSVSSKPFDQVFFDCDSTLTRIEGIDELARKANVAEQLIPLTTAAMNGEMTLDEVYSRRLELIQPSREDLDWLALRYQDALLDDAVESVNKLHQLGKRVHVISGGLRLPIIELGKVLGIPADNIHAVDIRFDEHNGYGGFDRNTPLACNGGKAKICQLLANAGEQNVLIGDGVTDLEAQQVDVFVVGFGGVVKRAEVVKRASTYVDGPGLLDVLDVILTSEEINRLQ
ncbi:MAG: HAD-IB family phosphatase [Gammaproteobacteria bacterium]|nr:HAD-IB family phosphatase [Gammaproteobacteria bacterium]